MSSHLTNFGKNTDSSSHSATYFIITVVAFTQGVLGLSDLSINYLYKDDFKLTPAQVAICTGLTNFPWIIKPLWGVISDGYPFFGYRRKSYLIFFGFLECFCWFSLSSWVRTPYEGVLVLFFVQTSVAFCNVIGEALLVELSRDGEKDKSQESLENSETKKQGEASKNVSLFFGIRSFGVFLTAYTGGLLLVYLNKKTIFAITALFPCLMAFGAFRLPEKSQKNLEIQENSTINSAEEESNKLIKKDKEAFKPVEESNYKKVCFFVKKPEIYRPIIFIFLFMITPSAGSSMFFFYTNELKFHPDFMGQLKLIHSLANMIGIFIYHRFLKLIPFKKLFAYSTMICTITGLTQILLVTRINSRLGIPDKFFSIGDGLIIQTFAEINTIPLLVLACRLCPKKIEGTMYALLMSTLNFGSMISHQLGGLFMHFLGITENDFHNLWILILIANCLMLLPLPMLFIVNFDFKKIDEEKNIDEKENGKNSEKTSTDSDKMIEIKTEIDDKEKND